MSVHFCGLELEHPIINASGTFDAIAARRAFGAELIEHFPFSAFVSRRSRWHPARPIERLDPVSGSESEQRRRGELAGVHGVITPARRDANV